LQSFIKNQEPTQLAIVASPRLPLEAQLVAARLSSTLGATLCTFVSEKDREAATTAVDLLRKNHPLSMHGLSECDLVAVVATDLLHDGPMLALALRQAARRGARIFAVAPTPTHELCQLLSLTITTVTDLSQIPFAEAKRPGIICGTTGVASSLLGSVCEKALPTLFLFPHPNTIGALLVAEGKSTHSLESGVAAGEITTIVALEADLPPELLKQLDVLAAADWQATATAKRAAIFLPTTAWLEMEGIYVNNEGRAQRFKRVMSPGIPLAQASPDIHPPHQHRLDPLGADIRPAWRLVADLLEGMTGKPIEEIYAGKWQLLQALEAEGEGILLLNPTTAKGAAP
jgi:NADH-quinone oxidoreductase subunit G